MCFCCEKSGQHARVRHMVTQRRRRTYRTRGRRLLHFTSSKWTYLIYIRLYWQETTGTRSACIKHKDYRIFAKLYIPLPSWSSVCSNSCQLDTKPEQYLYVSANMSCAIRNTALCHARITSTRIGHRALEMHPEPLNHRGNLVSCLKFLNITDPISAI